MPRTYTRTDPVIRFWAKVDKRGPDDCWPWLGASCNQFGHGAFSLGGHAGKQVVASRFSYALHNGPIPEGHYVCHRCDNPPCVNPAHLFVALPQGNVNDMIAKGREGFRKNKLRGSRHGGAKLTETDVIAIRAARGTGPRTVDIANQYGVSVSLIEKIWHRDAWTHI